MSSPVPAVEVSSLSYWYGTRRALDDVSMSTSEGAVCAILGPNGSGKTTLFRNLTTLLRPTAGSARIMGADVVAERDRVRAAIGVGFQSPSLDAKLTVLENLLHQGLLYGLRGATLRTRCAEVLTQFGVADRSDDRVERLSGGLRRRVELAKAVLHRPRVLILDEPSAGLDPAARKILIEYLLDVRKQHGVTALFTTHLMEEADRCDQVAVIHQGRLVAVDAPFALKQKIGGDVLKVAAREPALLKPKLEACFDLRAEVVDGTLRIERDRAHELVPRMIEAFPGEIDGISLGKPTLDDVFLHLTGHRLHPPVSGSEGNH